MGAASRSRTACPLSDVSLEREAALPVNSQSPLPSDRVFDFYRSSWVFVEPVCDMLGRAVSVTEDDG